jgi:hypothetical protein
VTRPVAQQIALRPFDQVVFLYGTQRWKPKRLPYPVHQVSVSWSEKNKMQFDGS